MITILDLDKKGHKIGVIEHKFWTIKHICSTKTHIQMDNKTQLLSRHMIYDITRVAETSNVIKIIYRYLDRKQQN